MDEGLTVLVEPRKLKLKQAVGKPRSNMIYTEGPKKVQDLVYRLPLEVAGVGGMV